MPRISIESFRKFCARWRERSEDFLRSLFDLEFTRLLTPRMLPTIYLFAIIASGWAVIAFVIEGFTRKSPAARAYSSGNRRARNPKPAPIEAFVNG